MSKKKFLLFCIILFIFIYFKNKSWSFFFLSPSQKIIFLILCFEWRYFEWICIGNRDGLIGYYGKKNKCKKFFVSFSFWIEFVFVFFYGYCFSLYRFEFLFPSFEMVLVGEWRIDFFELLFIFSQYINCKLTIKIVFGYLAERKYFPKISGFSF